MSDIFVAVKGKMSTGNRTLNLNKLPPVDAFTPVEARIVEMEKAGRSEIEIAEAMGMKLISLRKRKYTIREKQAVQR